MESDSGNVAISSGKTLGYLAQQQNLSTHKTIYDEVVGTRQDILQMEADIRENGRTNEPSFGKRT